ncbi:MAG: hypothetical protein RBR88_04820 [Candidatus Saccharicenans sp.]|nr:hypothetical protein [Candidatus Saccharicenans sp.]
MAVKRLGDLDAISREFAIEYSERLWKQLVVLSGSEASPPFSHGDVTLAVGLAIAAALAIKIPALFGIRISGSASDFAFYLSNVSLFVLLFLAVFFGLRRGLHRFEEWLWLAIPFIAAGVIVNLLPFKTGGQTQILVAIHFPIALWLMVCYAYSGGRMSNE